MQLRMTPEVTAQARSMYDKGISCGQIAKKLDIHPSTIQRGLRRAGVDVKIRQRIMPDVLMAAKALRDRGLPWWEVEEKIGHTRDSLRKLIREMQA